MVRVKTIENDKTNTTYVEYKGHILRFKVIDNEVYFSTKSVAEILKFNTTNWRREILKYGLNPQIKLKFSYWNERKIINYNETFVSTYEELSNFFHNVHQNSCDEVKSELMKLSVFIFELKVQLLTSENNKEIDIDKPRNIDEKIKKLETELNELKKIKSDRNTISYLYNRVENFVSGLDNYEIEYKLSGNKKRLTIVINEK